MKMKNKQNIIAAALVCVLAFTIALPVAAQETKPPNMPARNPWLTDSVFPTSHFNTAQTDAVLHAGPTKGGKLTAEQIKTLPTAFASNPTIKKIGNDTVLIASGFNRIEKILATGEAFEHISFMPYPGLEDLAKKASPEKIQAVLAEANTARHAKDDAAILALSKRMDEDLGFNFQSMMNGAYNAIDKDGFHYCVYGGVNVLKSTDDGKLREPLRVVKSVKVTDFLPADVAKGVTRFVGFAMTYDGYIVAAGSGLIVVLDRDLNVKAHLALPGEFVDNSIAIDEHNGIYVVTSKRMLKLVWKGEKLSQDEKDGAWSAEYNAASDPEKAMALTGSISRGSGTTPTLMGFGDDHDKLVLISDADEKGANLVAFWRDQIPAGFKQKPGTKSARIADQTRIDISTLTIEVSAEVLGYGATMMNGTYPKPAKGNVFGNAMVSGVTRPAPMGLQKFTWNPGKDQFEKAWLLSDIDNTDQLVPVISAKSNMIYAGTKTGGNYEYLGIDWTTGKVKARWGFPDDSRLWNGWGGIVTILEDGDLLLGGFFGIKRVNIGDGK